MADPLDDYLENLLGGGDPKAALDQYLLNAIGSTGEPNVNRAGISGGHGAPGGSFTPDENGYITGRAATFATPRDLANYSQTGSLATGDNGIGAWGHNTARLPGVAIPRDVLASVYGHPDAANGKTVEVIAPNGKSAILPILDKAPAVRNRANNAVIELTPAATQILGSGDAEGYRYRFNL
jgi:hypothetical protein